MLDLVATLKFKPGKNPTSLFLESVPRVRARMCVLNDQSFTIILYTRGVCMRACMRVCAHTLACGCGCVCCPSVSCRPALGPSTHTPHPRAPHPPQLSHTLTYAALTYAHMRSSHMRSHTRCLLLWSGGHQPRLPPHPQEPHQPGRRVLHHVRPGVCSLWQDVEFDSKERHGGLAMAYNVHPLCSILQCSCCCKGAGCLYPAFPCRWSLAFTHTCTHTHTRIHTHSHTCACTLACTHTQFLLSRVDGQVQASHQQLAAQACTHTHAC